MAELASRLIHLELLGLSVGIECEDERLRERLRTCYGRSLVAGRGADASALLTARLVPRGERFGIEVSGREDAEAEDREAALRGLNHELMHALMRRVPALYYVHAAVVEWEGQGVVLPGLSRAGKSTLALALLACGARYLSDELLAYDPKLRLAHAFPRALKVRDLCVDYFPDLAPYFEGSGEGRFLRFEGHGEAEPRERVPVSAIVLPRWSAAGDALDLQPIAPGAALLELAASSLNFGTHREESLRPLTSMVMGSRSFRLTWNEPHSAARRVLDALGGGA